MVRAARPDEDLAWLGVLEGAELFAGIDAAGWDASCWILSAMYVSDPVSSALTHDDVRKIEIAAGASEPVIIGSVNLDEVVPTTGGGLGYAPKPGGDWSRVRWADYRRDLARVATESQVPPCFRWVRPESWPANVEPPTEGSLDQTSFVALLATLAEVGGGWESDVIAFYGGGASGDWSEELHIWSGPLGAVAELVRLYGFTPSNLWPRDRSWFVYTDYDLWGTKVSGSRRLIRRIRSNGELETLRWPHPADPR